MVYFITQAGIVDADQLIQRARAGSDEAITELVARYRSYLEFVGGQEINADVQRKLGTSDIVQETMLQAHQSIGSFTGTTEPQFRHWIRQILMHEIVDACRRFQTQKREVNRECTLDSELPLPPDDAKTPRSAAVAEEEARLLAEAMQRLPAEYAEVIQLRNFDGLPLAEVADQMNRTTDAARKLWARAVERLKRELRTNESAR